MFLLQGTQVSDENGSIEPLRRYSEKTLVIVLPGDLTVFDIGKKITFKKRDLVFNKIKSKKLNIK